MHGVSGNLQCQRLVPPLLDSKRTGKADPPSDEEERDEDVKYFADVSRDQKAKRRRRNHRLQRLTRRREKPWHTLDEGLTLKSNRATLAAKTALV